MMPENTRQTLQISLLLPDLRGGGAERVQLDLAHEFVRAGHHVEFALMRKVGEFLEEAEHSFSVVDLGAPRARNLPIRLARYLRTRRPDALLAAMWPLTAMTPVISRFAGFRGKVLVSEHNTLSKQYEAWGAHVRALLRLSAQLGYRLADVRVGVSGGVCADMAKLSGMNPDQFIAIYNPVRKLAVSDPHALEMAERLWGEGGPRILTVGSLKPQKNHALLLRSFARLPLAEARLMLLGQGQLEGDLRALAADLGIADRVIFAGFHADPAPFYATANLFVLSSDHEGFGNVIVEAMFFGLPVVSTDCPSGPSEILASGRYGRLVPVGNTDRLAKAMRDTLASAADPDAQRRRAEDFTPDRVARRYLDLLSSVEVRA